MPTRQTSNPKQTVYRNDLVLRAFRGEQTDRTPIWMMRQAGRTDPAYNKLREDAGLPLEELFRNPELAAEISLLPKRIGVDAIIYFQDILTPLWPMGARFVFAPGPQLEQPIRDIRAVKSLRLFDVADELPFIPETFRLVRNSLDGEMPVLGFAGAPLTLAVFILEGKSFGGAIPHTQAFVRENPRELHQLLQNLTRMTIDYLHMQIDSGAAAVQLFESAANLFTPSEYEDFALPYQQEVIGAVRARVPTILFARGWQEAGHLEASGADVLSLPSEIPIREARKQLGNSRPVQGNLDNELLARGPLDAITEAAEACVREGEHCAHVFNLSHGLLRHTPFEHVTHLVDTVRGYRCPANGEPA